MRRTISAFFAAFFVGVLAGAEQPLLAATLSDVEQALLGRWTGTWGNQARTRTLEVLSISQDGQIFSGHAFYGYSDSPPAPARLTITPAGDDLTIEFASVVGSNFSLKTVAADRMEGVAVSENGAKARMVFKSAPTEGPVIAPDTVPSQEDMERALFGSWLVKVGTAERLRSFEIREIVAKGNSFAGTALWGFADANPRPAPLSVAITNGIVSVDFINSAKSHIQARLVAPDRMEGVLTGADGKSYWTTFRSSDEVDQTSGSAFAPLSSRDQKLTIIYIAALNCEPCRLYEGAFHTQPHGAKRAFVKFADGKNVAFRDLSFTSYTNTDEDRGWPADLNWVRSKTYAKSGTPRFILVNESRIIANVHGRLKVQKLVDEINRIRGG